MKKALRLAALVLALLGGATAATPAVAEAPDKTTETVIGYSEPNNDCGFPMDHVSDLVVTEEYFFDSTAGLREYRQTVRVLRATFTNTLTGKFVTMEGGRYTYTYRAGEAYGTITGRVAIVSAPREGLIMQDAGRIQISAPPTYATLFSAGQHDVLNATFGTLCTYLG